MPGEPDVPRHLACERRILGLELDQLHDPLARNQLEESSMNNISVFRSLAGR
jgi:hypothetical protein